MARALRIVLQIDIEADDDQLPDVIRELAADLRPGLSSGPADVVEDTFIMLEDLMELDGFVGSFLEVLELFPEVEEEEPILS